MGPEALGSHPKEIPRAPIEVVRPLLWAKISEVIEGNLGEFSVLVGKHEYPSDREVVFHQFPKEITELPGGKRFEIGTDSVDIAFCQIMEEQLGVNLSSVEECLKDDPDQKIDAGYDHTISEWQFGTIKDNVQIVFKRHISALGEMGWEWAVRNTHPKGPGTKIKEKVQRRIARLPIISFPY